MSYLILVTQLVYIRVLCTMCPDFSKSWLRVETRGKPQHVSPTLSSPFNTFPHFGFYPPVQANPAFNVCLRLPGKAMPRETELQGIPHWQKKTVIANSGECAWCGGGGGQTWPLWEQRVDSRSWSGMSCMEQWGLMTNSSQGLLGHQHSL